MFGTQNLGMFVTAGLLLNLTPGPDTMYILGRTIAQGRAAGVASALGISSGCLVHSIAVAFGLSAILVNSAVAFTCVKLAGAGYLIYLGAKMLCERPELNGGNGRALAVADTWTIYRQGFVTNVLNPKVALFFMAFLPQFVAPAEAHGAVPFLFLGAVFIFNGTLYCLMLVLFASALTRRFRNSGRASNLFKRITGALFVGLGVRLGFER